MARILLRLKLRLLANGFVRSTQAAFGLAVASLAACIGAIVGFVSFAGGGARVGVEVWGDAVVLGLATLVVVWIVVPLLTFSSDETLDPSRLALLPIRPHQLVPGLTLAGLTGIVPGAAVLGSLGIVVGAGRASGSIVGALLASVAVAAVLLLAVTWSRALAAVLSNVLASRRGAEVAAAIGALLAVAAYAAFLAVQPGGFAEPEDDPAPVTVDDLDLSPVVEVARLTPGGLGGDAVARAAAGDLRGSLLRSAAVVALAGVGVGAWIVALGRVDRRAGTTRASTSTRRSSLYPRALRWLPRTRTTAVAVRFLRGLVRDPRVRTAALGQAILVLPITFVAITGGVLTSPRAPVLAAYVVLPLALVGTNGAALDGPALWQHELAGADHAADLRGRTLGLALLATPVLVVGASVLAAISGGWAAVPFALVLGVAVFLLTSGVAVLTSVVLPIPVPERGANRFGSSLTGQGCVNSLGLAVVLLLLGVLSIPLVLAGAFASGIWVQALTGGLALAYGTAALWLGTRAATSRADARGPDLLQVVDPRSA